MQLCQRCAYCILGVGVGQLQKYPRGKKTGASLCCPNGSPQICSSPFTGTSTMRVRKRKGMGTDATKTCPLPILPPTLLTQKLIPAPFCPPPAALRHGILLLLDSRPPTLPPFAAADLKWLFTAEELCSTVIKGNPVRIGLPDDVLGVSKHS